MQNNLTVNQELTLATFEEDEKWLVKTQDKSYTLSGKQAQALKELSNSGSRGLIWFRDFAISIPHIMSVERLQNSQKVINKKRDEFASKFGIIHQTSK
jgi:hypothetical protein